MHQNISSCLFV